MIFNKNNLPMYIKDKSKHIPIYGEPIWIGILDNNKEYYSTPSLEYNYSDKYVINQNCEIKVYDLINDYENEKDDDGRFEIATEEEYNYLKNKFINNRKEELKGKIKYLEKELKDLENSKL